jgi:hypothetical protein
MITKITNEHEYMQCMAMLHDLIDENSMDDELLTKLGNLLHEFEMSEIELYNEIKDASSEVGC